MLVISFAALGCETGEAAAEAPAQAEEQMETAVFDIDGMSCVNCARAIEDGLDEAEHVIEGDIDFGAERLSVEYDGDQIDVDGIIELIDEIGFEATPVD